MDAYGACWIQRVTVSHAKTKAPAERDEMNFTALPGAPVTRYQHSPAYAGRHNGQLTNAQRPQHVQGVGERLPNGARPLSARTRHGGTGRRGPVDVRQRKSMSLMTMNRPAANVDHSAAVPAGETDRRQAAYFLRLLTERCRQADDRINKYQRAIAVAEARGAVDYAGALGHPKRMEEQERQVLQGLIDRLQRRFSLSVSGEVPAVAQRGPGS